MLSQLRTQGSNLLRCWSHISPSSNPSQGPKWFQAIRDHLTDSLCTVFRQFQGPSSSLKPEEEQLRFNIPFYSLLHNDETKPAPIQAWTDGSLGADRLLAGCAVVFSDQAITATIERFSPMSSTTAELGALLLALETAPANLDLHIFSDSQVAIAKLKRWDTSLTTRQKLREPEHQLLDCIKDLCDNRAGNVKIEWIKGHSGSIQNELADRLANEARIDSNEPLIVASLTSVQFTLRGKKGILFGYPRSLLKLQARLAHDFCLRSSSHSALLPTNPFSYEITIAALKSCEKAESSLFTTQSNSTFRAFRYKWIAGILPIGSRMRHWGATFNSTGICRRCLLAEETMSHLLSCPNADLAHANFHVNFKEEFRQLWEGEANVADFVSSLFIHCGLNLALFDGTCNASLNNLTKKLPPNVPAKSTAIAMLRALWKVVYFDIWLPRCHETVVKEKSLGILQRHKRQPHHKPLPLNRVCSTALKMGKSLVQDEEIWALTF